jgi:hypothetical protein
VTRPGRNPIQAPTENRAIKPEDNNRLNTQSGDVVMLAEQPDDVMSASHPVSKADTTTATTAGRHLNFTA